MSDRKFKSITSNGNKILTCLVLFASFLNYNETQADPLITPALSSEGSSKTGPIESQQADLLDESLLGHLERVGSSGQNRAHVKHLLNAPEFHNGQEHLNAVEILHSSGFESQTCNVSSPDGYITQIVRIINPLVERGARKFPPVVIYGGQGVSSALFVAASLGSLEPAQWPINPEWPDQANAPNRSLAITLANNGYDVWLVSARGSDEFNSYRISEFGDSQYNGVFGLIGHLGLKDKFRHVLFNGNDPEASYFWSFSHDEIIKYEFRAQIDRILSETGSNQVSLITYSNGGFIAYAFASLHPNYALRHIDTMISLAPAVFTNKYNLVLGAAGLLSKLSGPNSTVLGENLNYLAHALWHKFCKSKVVRYTACKAALNLLYGCSDHFQTHMELGLIEQIGRPISVAGFRQSLQCGFAERLQQYDHGIIGNMITYDQLSPPAYELGRMKLTRTYVFTGEHDSIVNANSIRQLFTECGVEPAEHVEIPGYNHLDLVAAWDVDEQVNGPILHLLDDRWLELAYDSYDSSDGTDSKHVDAPLNEQKSTSLGKSSTIGPNSLIDTDQLDQLGHEVHHQGHEHHVESNQDDEQLSSARSLGRNSVRLAHGVKQTNGRRRNSVQPKVRAKGRGHGRSSLRSNKFVMRTK